jgi:hypothetical protein
MPSRGHELHAALNPEAEKYGNRIASLHRIC